MKTVIGFGAPNKQGTAKAHGAPLGETETALAKETYQWLHEPFYVPKEVQDKLKQSIDRNLAVIGNWQLELEHFTETQPELAQNLKRAIEGKIEIDGSAFSEFDQEMSTRDAFGQVINQIAPQVSTLLGGSADLSGSNKTLLYNEDHFGPKNYAGRNIFYGVREHAMGAIMNGMCLHGGVVPYAGTFLVFSDYLRPSIRLAALMKQPALYVFTHDSIAVGEDGPTHEPIEQITALRCIPGLVVLRPADAEETAQGLRFALEHRDRPVAFALTRQKLPIIQELKGKYDDFKKGAYILYEAGTLGDDTILFMATGSEIQLVLEAAKKLAAEGKSVRVINMTSMEQFDAQPKSYREAVLPSALNRRVAVEMGHPMPWYKYLGTDGKVLAVERFGASAPGNIVMSEFGFTVENVLKLAADWD